MLEGSFNEFHRVVIDKYTGPEISDFSVLRKQYGTGQGILLSRNPEKKYGYRIGVQCVLGDIEVSEWQRLVEELIERCGEQKLQTHLIEWVMSYGRARNTKEARLEALELHAMRIFDDEEWYYFIPFNQRFRPEFLSNCKLVSINTDCCKSITAVTYKQAYSNTELKEQLYCPICGKYSKFNIIP